MSQTLGEWRVPVSPKLSVADLSVLASSCRSVGCKTVAFSYRGASGKPLPDVPSKEDLAKVATASGLSAVLARLDLEDVSNVAALPKLLATAVERFDVFCIALREDPLVFERNNMTKPLAALSDSKIPLVINIDDCPTTIIIPRKHAPSTACVEISYANFMDHSKSHMADVKTMKQLRSALPQLKRFPLLVSCGGDVIGTSNASTGALRIRSPIDAACLAESLTGRAEALELNRKMTRSLVAARIRASEQRLAEAKQQQQREAIVESAKVLRPKTVTACDAPPTATPLTADLLSHILTAHFGGTRVEKRRRKREADAEAKKVVNVAVAAVAAVAVEPAAAAAAASAATSARKTPAASPTVMTPVSEHFAWGEHV